jgi:hypothetical protein
VKHNNPRLFGLQVNDYEEVGLETGQDFRLKKPTLAKGMVSISFCHLVIKAVRVDSNPFPNSPLARGKFILITHILTQQP